MLAYQTHVHRDGGMNAQEMPTNNVEHATIMVVKSALSSNNVESQLNADRHGNIKIHQNRGFLSRTGSAGLPVQAHTSQSSKGSKEIDIFDQDETSRDNIDGVRGTDNTNNDKHDDGNNTGAQKRPTHASKREPSDEFDSKYLKKTGSIFSSFPVSIDAVGDMDKRRMSTRRMRFARLAAPLRRNPWYGDNALDGHSPAVLFAQQHYAITTEIICDVLSAICIIRCIFVFHADASSLSFYTIRNFFGVFIPFHLYVSGAIHMHDHLFAKPDIIHLIFTAVRLVNIVGLAWNAPLVFATSNNTMTPFVFFLFGGRMFLSFAHIFVGISDPIWWALLLLKSVVMVVPLTFWIASINTEMRDQAVLLFLIGVAADVLTSLTMDGLEVWFEDRRERLIRRQIAGSFVEESLSEVSEPQSDSIKDRSKAQWRRQATARMIIFTSSLFVACVPIVFPINIGAVYPDSVWLFKFDLNSFLAASAGVVILYTLHSIYSSLFGWRLVQLTHAGLWNSLSHWSNIAMSGGASAGGSGDIAVPTKNRREMSPSDSIINSQGSATPEGRPSQAQLLRKSDSSQAPSLPLEAFQKSKPVASSLSEQIEEDISHDRNIAIMDKLARCLHLCLHTAILVMAAGIQLQLRATYRKFADLPTIGPRLPVNVSVSSDFTGSITSLGVTGVDYLAAATGQLSSTSSISSSGGDTNPFMQWTTSRLTSAGWSAITLVLVGAGATVAILACIGVTSTAITIASLSKEQGRPFIWKSLAQRIGIRTILRLVFAILLVIVGSVSAIRTLTSDTWMLFGLSGVLFIACIIEDGRRILAIDPL